MAATYRTSASNFSNGTATLVITAPSGIVDGDLLIACFASTDNAVQTLAGWTSIRSDSSGGGGVNSTVQSYYKTASSEGASYTWNITLSVPVCGCIIRIDGHDPVTPIDTSEGGGNSLGGTSLTFGTGITPTVSSDLLIQIWGGYRAGGALTDINSQAIATSNPTWTEIADVVTSTGNNIELSVVYGTRPQTTSTGASTATSAQSTSRYSGSIIGIKRLLAFTSTITDTVTVTDAITVVKSLIQTITDTVTVTDTVTTTKTRNWTNSTKTSSTTWVNDTKH